MGRILVSGMGAVSAIGNNVAEIGQSLRESRSGLGLVRYLKTDHTEFPVGEVKLTNEEMEQLLHIRCKGEKKIVPATRTALLGMLAVREALAGMSLIAPRKNAKIAFISGTTVGGMDKSEQFYQDFLENNSKDEYIKSHDCGACSEMIADYFGVFNQVQTISTACSSAANAIAFGAELLKSGRADTVIAGGTECITKFHLNGFNTLMILDKEFCRPFDATRAGLNLGEGAAYIVMQREDDVQSKPLAALSGYANTCDAYHQTASSPEGDGAFCAMKKALENADLKPSGIDYINAHGTGTANNDLSEGIAIQRLFGDKIPFVSSTKAFTGHTTSAAGSIEAVISILALLHDFIPENLNFKNKMEELCFAPYVFRHCGLDARPIEIKNVLSNSFGFGGNDTSLIFSKI